MVGARTLRESRSPRILRPWFAARRRREGAKDEEEEERGGAEYHGAGLLACCGAGHTSGPKRVRLAEPHAPSPFWASWPAAKYLANKSK